jgi:hypothetical protein
VAKGLGRGWVVAKPLGRARGRDVVGMGVARACGNNIWGSA